MPKFTIDELYTAVQADRPQVLSDEAADWRAVAGALRAQSRVLRGRLEAMAGKWSSGSGDAYVARVRRRQGELDEAATAADDNAESWTRVAELAGDHKARVEALYDQWQREKRDLSPDELDAKRLEYDRQGSALATATVTTARQHTQRMRPISRMYRPFSAGLGDGGGSGASGNGGPGTGVPRRNGSAEDADGSGGAETFRPGATGPQLQAPVTATPAPTAPPTVPLAGGGSTPAPVPGFGPGPRSVSPPGIRPTLRFAPANSARPTPPLGGTRMPTVPRGPQSTVRPVIGSRPGTTGMAPTGNRGPVRNGLARPVIGSRPGLTPGTRATPAKPLIGRGGVVGGRRGGLPGVRAARPHWGEGVNRSVVSGVRQPFKPETGRPATVKPRDRHADKESEYRAEGGDYVWSVAGEVVPGVIRGGDSWEGRVHERGPVADLRGEPTAEVDEHAVRRRLALPGVDRGPDSDDVWAPRSSGRGVIDRPGPAADWRTVVRK